MHNNMKKKMHFTLQLMIYLILKSIGAPEGTTDDAPKNSLSDLYKYAQEGACEVAVELYLSLHLLMH